MGYMDAARVRNHTKAKTPAQLLVVLEIAFQTGPQWTPSIEHITAGSRLDRKTVLKALDELKASGEVAISKHGRMNRYAITSLCNKECECLKEAVPVPEPGTAKRPKKEATGPKNGTESGDDQSQKRDHYQSQKRDHNGPKNGTIPVPFLGHSKGKEKGISKGSDTLVSPELDEPVQDVVSTPVQEQKTCELPQQRTSEENYTWGFDSFVKAYPKPGSNFIRTKNAFTYYANNRADAEKIIRSAICYKRSLVWKNSDGKENNPFQFAKDPAEWLKAGEWRRDDWPTHPHGDWMSKGIHEGKLDRQVAEAIASEDLRVAGGAA